MLAAVRQTRCPLREHAPKQFRALELGALQPAFFCAYGVLLASWVGRDLRADGRLTCVIEGQEAEAAGAELSRLLKSFFNKARKGAVLVGLCIVAPQRIFAALYFASF